jgi:hypothetical protein
VFMRVGSRPYQRGQTPYGATSNSIFLFLPVPQLLGSDPLPRNRSIYHGAATSNRLQHQQRWLWPVIECMTQA